MEQLGDTEQIEKSAAWLPFRFSRKAGMMKKFVLALVPLVAMAFSGTAHAGFIIDHFDTPNYSVTLGSGSTGFVFVGPDANTANVGGGRYIDLTINSNTIPLTAAADLTALPAGVLSLSNKSGVSSTLSIRWLTGDLDMLQDGALSVIMDLLDADLAGSFKLTLTDTSLNSANDTFVTVSGGAQAIVFNYSSFAGVNLSHIKQIDLMVTGASNFDMTIDQIQTGTVPEPTSIALAGFAGLGMAVGAIRRRRQAKQAA